MATRTIDLNDLVRIRDPQRNAPPRVLGAWPGNATSPTRVALNRIVTSTEKLLRAAYDIRGNRNFGLIEAGERLREASGPSLRELNELATALRTDRDTLQGEVRRINPAKPYEQCGHWQAALDLRLLDAFKALPTAERATTLHQLQNNPMLCWDLADAMLRLPRMVTGLEHSEWQGIKLSLFRTWKHDEFNSLDERMQQVNFAQNAVRVAVDTAIETVGTRADVMGHAPAALAMAQASDLIDWNA
ncbi:MAG TPA: hypothetical protein VLK85_11090 [Ramlibacter sp.]|nr:hypothetical protein [Ramlibacter sp.]